MIKKFNKFSLNEGAPNFELQDDIMRTESYKNLKESMSAAISLFLSELQNEMPECDITDDAVNMSIQSAADNAYGY